MFLLLLCIQILFDVEYLKVGVFVEIIQLKDARLSFKFFLVMVYYSQSIINTTADFKHLVSTAESCFGLDAYQGFFRTI